MTRGGREREGRTAKRNAELRLLEFFSLPQTDDPLLLPLSAPHALFYFLFETLYVGGHLLRKITRAM